MKQCKYQHTHHTNDNAIDYCDDAWKLDIDASWPLLCALQDISGSGNCQGIAAHVMKNTERYGLKLTDRNRLDVDNNKGDLIAVVINGGKTFYTIDTAAVIREHEIHMMRANKELRNGGRRGYNRCIEHVVYKVDAPFGTDIELKFEPAGALNWFIRSKHLPAWRPVLTMGALKRTTDLGALTPKVELKEQYR